MIYLTIQARTQSTRFPNKILQPLYKEVSVLETMIRRLSSLKNERNDIKFCILTTLNPKDDIINEMFKNKCEVDIIFRGSENNVFFRMNDFMDKHCESGDIIIDLTSDCPLIDYRIVSNILNSFLSGEFDYASNVITRSYPDGMDVQIYNKNIFKNLYDFFWPFSVMAEHTGWNIVNSIGIMNEDNDYKVGNFPAKKNMFYPDLGLTLDEPEDLTVLQNVFNHFDRINFSYEEIINLYKNKPELFQANKNTKRKIPGV